MIKVKSLFVLSATLTCEASAAARRGIEKNTKSCSQFFILPRSLVSPPQLGYPISLIFFTVVLNGIKLYCQLILTSLVCAWVLPLQEEKSILFPHRQLQHAPAFSWRFDAQTIFCLSVKNQTTSDEVSINRRESSQESLNTLKKIHNQRYTCICMFMF